MCCLVLLSVVESREKKDHFFQALSRRQWLDLKKVRSDIVKSISYAERFLVRISEISFTVFVFFILQQFIKLKFKIEILIRISNKHSWTLIYLNFLPRYLDCWSSYIMLCSNYNFGAKFQLDKSFSNYRSFTLKTYKTHAYINTYRHFF